ncbi:MAG: MBOAT family protein [Clostridia bacterium]|nr:MBOAT family protein [Clostridia bacterium]
MVFSSLTFWFIYLPLVLVLYYVTPKKARNIVLFLVSLAFYGWGEPVYISLMLITILINYIAGYLISKSQSKKKLWLILSVVLNLSFLVFFKYSGMIVSTLNLLPFINISFSAPALPIGISFYTFQAMSYTIDVYREECSVQKNPLVLGTYVTLFPQLIAGPIVRYTDVETQLTKRKETLEKFKSGVLLFLAGMGKKVLLANQFALMYKNLSETGDGFGVLASWAGLLALTLQIYFDFSGYSDMARGLGRMIGFEFMVNFNYPYISRSITEFWRRWHISLSTWFRDYVYIPLGGNRKGFKRQIFNLFIVWLLTGLWHGASYNFVLWGLYFFVILACEKLFLSKILNKAPKAVGHIYSIVLIMLGWAIFSFDNMSELTAFLGSLFGAQGVVATEAQASVMLSYLPICLAGCVLSTPLIKVLYEKVRNAKYAVLLETAFCIVIMLLCTASLVSESYNPFIYFRF